MAKLEDLTADPTPKKHSHYFKNVEVLTHIDVYRLEAVQRHRSLSAARR